MKVDVVVNSMRQQLDPATQARMIPTLSYRPGELLRGQVMLADGERLQVRLDNGRLLNALPADDVLLSPGSTVTLRVTGSMDGTEIMQLLSQEPSEAQLLGGEQTTDMALLRLGVKPTEDNRALYAALSRWQAQPDGETMGRAVALLREFPELGPDGAAFLAANRIPAGREQVDALLRLVAGYHLGDDLQALAETLLNRLQVYRGEGQSNSAAQLSALIADMAQSTQTPQPAVITGGQTGTNPTAIVDQSQSNTIAAQGAQPQAGLSTQTGALAAAPQPQGTDATPTAPMPLPQSSSTMPAAADPLLQSLSAMSTAAVLGVETMPDGQTAALAMPQGEAAVTATVPLPTNHSAVPSQVTPLVAEGQGQAVPTIPLSTGAPTPAPLPAGMVPAPLTDGAEGVAMPTPQPTPMADGASELNSLVALAFEGQPAQQMQQAQPALLALAQAGSEGQAAGLLLDSLLLPPQEATAQLEAFVQTLPTADQPAVRQLLGTVLDQLRALVGTQMAATAAAGDDDGLPRLIRTVASLFVAVGAAADAGGQLQQAAAERNTHLQELAARLDTAVPGDRDAARQVQRMNTTASLISDINQYAYQQIPVQMNDRTRTVELYVMKNGKGRKKIDPENANILIALDTDHMGHLETAVHVSKKTVRLRFGVERPDLVGHVNGYLPDLANAMQAIGYRLGDLRLQVIERPVTPLTAPQAAEEEPVPQGRLDITL